MSPRECLHLISSASRDSGKDGGGMYVAAGTLSKDWRYMRDNLNANYNITLHIGGITELGLELLNQTLRSSL